MLDPITLEVIWRRLISVVDEQAAALIHSSFTTVVREAGDLSAGVFDRAGNMVAQSVTGTPGHINTMANCVRKFIVPQYPIDSLQPGDTLITNDPWEASGHLFDLTIVSPVFYRGRGVAFFASTCHAVDIGGATMGGDARSLHEEGLAIPLMKLFKGGEPNRELFDIIRANVRVPDQVIGDIYAQEVGNQVGARKLIEMLGEYNLPDIEAVSASILQRTEAAVRAAIGALPDGVCRDNIQIDGFDTPLTIACEITVDGDELRVDYEGSSPQVDRGINVVLNYTHAYTTYTLMAALAPGIPNNEGAFRPISVAAPEGSILNCRRPAPVSARHLIGHFVSQPLLTALAQILPQRVIANGSAGLWNTMMDGLDERGEEFAYIFFSAGGMGAAHDRDGLSATAFPSGIMGVPVEAIETAAPLLMHRRELRVDSGGGGQIPRWAGASHGIGDYHRRASHAQLHVRPHQTPGAGIAWRQSRRSGQCPPVRRRASAPQEPLPLAARSARDFWSCRAAAVSGIRASAMSSACWRMCAPAMSAAKPPRGSMASWLRRKTFGSPTPLGPPIDMGGGRAKAESLGACPGGNQRVAEARLQIALWAMLRRVGASIEAAGRLAAIPAASNGHAHRRAGYLVGHDGRFETEDLEDCLRRHECLRRSLRHNLPAAQGNDSVGIARGVIEVLQDHGDCATRLIQARQQVEHIHLVGEVQVGRRFIQQQGVSLLRQGHGDPGALTLPAAERIQRAVGEERQVGGRQRLVDDAFVCLAPLLEPALMRIAPLRDQVMHRQSIRRDRRLRQDAQLTRQRLRLHFVNVAAIEVDAASRRLQQARNGAQQGQLAAAVRANQRGYCAGFN